MHRVRRRRGLLGAGRGGAGRLGLTESETGEAVTERLDETLERYSPQPTSAPGCGRGWPAARGRHPRRQSREELFAAWAAFFERVGEGHVVVLVIDDAHHADDGLLDFVDHVLGAARFPIFVLALARTGLMARRPDLAANRRTTLLHLEPLEPAQMERLLDGLVAGLPVEARTVLVERAEGIPLYAVETVRALIDLDLVLPVGGRYVLAEGAAGELAKVSAPASLQALVAARLDSLTPAERRVVADASVLGMTFTQSGSGPSPGTSPTSTTCCAASCASSSCRSRPTASAPSGASTGSCSRSCARSRTTPCPTATARPGT